MACTSAAAAAFLLASMGGASAVNMETLQNIASGVEAYYQSRDRCYYHPSIDAVIEKTDAFFDQQYGYLWETLRERVAPSVQNAENMQRILEPNTPPGDQAYCHAVSIFVPYALASGLSVAGPTAEIFQEMSRLSSSGRAK